MDLAFHSIHYSPFFGGTTPLMDVLTATAAAGFRRFDVAVCACAAVPASKSPAKAAKIAPVTNRVMSPTQA